MKTKKWLSVCILGLLTVHLTYARWPQVDPHAENYFNQTPYAFAGNNPVKHVDPNGKDYYQSVSGSVIWQDDNARKLMIYDEMYKNIGASYSQQISEDIYVNYYQGQVISTSTTAVEARQTILDNPTLAGSLLSKDSQLSTLSQEGLMTDMIHQAQGDFIAGSTDYAGSALETTGNGLATAGYALSVTGVGASVGAAMSGLGNVISGVGTGLRLAVDLTNKNYKQAAFTFFGYISNYGVTKLATYGAMGSGQIKAGVNLFFTPMNIFIGNIKPE